MLQRISVEIKEFLMDKFSNESDFDNLCRDIKLHNIYSGDYSSRVNAFLRTLEQNFPDAIERLYNALLALKPGFKEEINRLFQVNNNVQVNKNVQVYANNMDKILSFAHNNLSQLPDDLFNYPNLETLDLSHNNLEKLSDRIADLNNLRYLNLEFNQLSSLPDSIVLLKNLEYMNISNNSFSQFPEEITELHNLKELYIAENNIETIPSSIIRLSQLQIFDATNNIIRKIPQNLLDIKELRSLQTIGNPLEQPPLEIANMGIESIRNYFQSMVVSGKSYEFEAKLIIVGEGGVGKTSLVQKIINPSTDINHNEPPTMGIEINRWVVDTGMTNNFMINIWDFGGQEIYHATHQFFLTKRSLYLLVWNARRDDSLYAFEYWLNIIKTLSDNAPVIIVQNRIDVRKISINERLLRNNFPNIISFHLHTLITTCQRQH